MRKQDYLPLLIKSMDANEKRHFRILSDSEQGDKNYLKLFDALDGKDRYNATELSETLDISASGLSSLKHYLTQVLLKSLRHYRDGADVESEAANSILEASSLKARGLGDFAIDILDKAIARVRDEQSYFELSRLLAAKHWHLHNAIRYDELQQVEQEFLASQSIATEILLLNGLNSQITQFEQSRRPPEEFQQRDNKFFHIKPDELLSHRARIMWYSIMNRYHLVISRNKHAQIDLARGEVAYYDSSLWARETYPHDFLLSCIRLMTTEYQNENYQEAWQASEKLSHLLSQKYAKVRQAYIDDMSLFTRIVRGALHYAFGQYEQGAKVLRAVYSEKHKMIGYVQYTMIYEYAKVLMQLRQSVEAADRIDELLQFNNDMRMDLQAHIRPMMILLQLDMGHYQIVPYQVKSARQWMKRRKISNGGVEMLLSHAYAIATAPLSKRKDAWIKLQSALDSDTMLILEKELHLKKWLSYMIQNELHIKSAAVVERVSSL